MVNDYDLSSLSYMISGAAPLSSGLAESLRAKLKGKTAIIQGYVSHLSPLLFVLQLRNRRLTKRKRQGMTETTSVALLPALNGGVPGSCGQLIASMEARLVDAETGKDVPNGASGELWLRGPNIMMYVAPFLPSPPRSRLPSLLLALVSPLSAADWKLILCGVTGVTISIRLLRRKPLPRTAGS